MPRTGVPPTERLAAWLITGPVGHLVAGVIDWVEMLVRWRVSVWRERRAGRSAS